jgi:hypothetical protein
VAQGYPNDNDPAKFFDFDLVHCRGWFDTAPVPGRNELVEENPER